MCFRAYEYFKLAAKNGHPKAKEYLGFGMLLGDHMDLDPEVALKIFQELSEKGSPKGQLVLWFLNVILINFVDFCHFYMGFTSLQLPFFSYLCTKPLKIKDSC